MKLRKIYVVLLVGSFSFQTYAQAVSNIDGSSNVENPVGNLNIGTGGVGITINNTMNSSDNSFAIIYNQNTTPINPESGVLIVQDLRMLPDRNATGATGVVINASNDSITKIASYYNGSGIVSSPPSRPVVNNLNNFIAYDLNIGDNSQLIIDGFFQVIGSASDIFFKINSSSTKATIINQYYKNDLQFVSGYNNGILYKLENTADAEINLKGQTWMYLADLVEGEADLYSLIDTTSSSGTINTKAFNNFLTATGGDGAMALISFEDRFAAYRGGASKDIYTQEAGTAGGVFLMGDGDDAFHAKSGGLAIKLDMGAGNDIFSLHDDVNLVPTNPSFSTPSTTYPFAVIRDLFVIVPTPVEVAWTNKVDGGSGIDSINLISRVQNIFSDSTSAENLRVINAKDIGFTSNEDYSVSEFFEGQIDFRALNLINFENLNVLNNSHAYLVGNLDLGGSNGQASVDNTSSLGLQRVAVLDGVDQGLARKINGSLVNAGVVDIASDDIQEFNTLEVLSYEGKGGILKLDTVLDDGTTGSDKLVINGVNGGTGFGNSQISIRQKGGLGALTVGKGIQVIEAINGATTTSDAFSLYQPVSAGAYSYNLYRNSDESWYLSTNIVDPTDPNKPNNPDYSDEPFAVSVFPSLAQYYGAATLSSWRERMGGWAYADPKKIGITNTAPSPLWVRLGTQHGKHHGGKKFNPTADSQAFSPRFNYESNFLQMGLDVYRGYSEDHSRTAAGLFVTTGSIHGNVRGFHELNGVLENTQSTATLDNIALGGYWTKIAQDGSYVDLVSQYIQHDLSTQAGGDKLTASGNSFMASVEAGKAYAVSNNWTLVPQGQLRWQNVRLGNKKSLASQSEVGSYSFSNNQALQARVGLEMRYQSQVQRGFWMRLDALHEFKGDSKVRYTPKVANSKTPEFVNSRKGSSLELLAGADLKINENVSFFTSVGYQHGLSSVNKGNAWNANVALRWGF